jgi:predicted alternative tryptophan synthase beta-subunit
LKALGTPARIYYKYARCPAGSHKPNTAVPQFIKCRGGRKKLTTETGGLGHRTAFACALSDLR